MYAHAIRHPRCPEETNRLAPRMRPMIATEASHLDVAPLV